MLKSYKKKLKNTTDEGIQIFLLSELGKFSKGPTVQDTLLRYTESPSVALRSTAFDALIKNGHKEVINAAIKHLDDEYKVVIRCIELLGFHRILKAIPLLKSLMNNPNKWIQFYAADNLGDMNDDSLISFLSTQLEGEIEDIVRSGCYSGIIKLVEYEEDVPFWIGKMGELLMNTKDPDAAYVTINSLTDFADAPFSKQIITILQSRLDVEEDNKLIRLLEWSLACIERWEKL
ncbi:HEAT repeat domain-containing protein [Listeria cornellensis]|uniref:HEAT repeat-containing protein n=1 Tax=Listeria cornellensis FSL F6-0969 TaxID=1265820 RepID=W7BQP5_9LIST|nr:HEAT repeat domain-containing protein [Listeria cornellensis]EUJ25501.1 HEAT repeat-containing protein [Listeria cornellensis FSL F6-0969]